MEQQSAHHRRQFVDVGGQRIEQGSVLAKVANLALLRVTAVLRVEVRWLRFERSLGFSFRFSVCPMNSPLAALYPILLQQIFYALQLAMYL